MYFDESGDLGLLEGGSNTENFSIAVYKESSKEETVLLAEKIRRELGLSNTTTLKWNKLSVDRRLKFKRIFNRELKDKVFVIYWDKNIDRGELFSYEIIFEKLIKYFRLTGNFKFDGVHLKKGLEKLKRKLKVIGIRVNFQEVSTKENVGIQIADLVAGFVRTELSNGYDLGLENIVKL